MKGPQFNRQNIRVVELSKLKGQRLVIHLKNIVKVVESILDLHKAKNGTGVDATSEVATDRPSDESTRKEVGAKSGSAERLVQSLLGKSGNAVAEKLVARAKKVAFTSSDLNHVLGFLGVCKDLIMEPKKIPFQEIFQSELLFALERVLLEIGLLVTTKENRDFGNLACSIICMVVANAPSDYLLPSMCFVGSVMKAMKVLTNLEVLGDCCRAIKAFANDSVELHSILLAKGS